MSYAVELYFDNANQARLRSLRDECGRIGGLAMREDDARPHVSLIVADSVDLQTSQTLLEKFAHKNRPFTLSLASIGFFPSSEQVVFLAPKVSRELLALHESFFGEFATIGVGIWQHYAPSTWVPHCTLATKYPLQQVAPLLDSCRAFGLPLVCTVVEIGLVQFPPVKQIATFALAK